MSYGPVAHASQMNRQGSQHAVCKYSETSVEFFDANNEAVANQTYPAFRSLSFSTRTSKSMACISCPSATVLRVHVFTCRTECIRRESQSHVHWQKPFWTARGSRSYRKSPRHIISMVFLIYKVFKGSCHG